uniref:Uncharacterized protein n=1 Tax=Ascaris lumbricoides TaxID=6252 RepID=A0A0M3I1T7_ASCLU
MLPCFDFVDIFSRANASLHFFLLCNTCISLTLFGFSGLKADYILFT